MTFENDKKNILSRLDKSKKGEIDKDIARLVSIINNHPDYYTTSSCSGRILLIERKTNKKKDSHWQFISHRKTKFQEFGKALANLPNGDIWFKEESLILHVCCRNIESAKKLLNLVRDAGIKRAGIISIGKRIIIEIIGTEAIETLVARKGRLIVDENYLKILVKEANKKLKRNLIRIKKLEKELLIL